MIKRTSMILYSRTDIFCHRTRLVLAEKGVTSDIINLDYQEEPLEDFLQLNPAGSVPTLVDRELVLTQSSVIMEYLDERFPHPPLLPVYPVQRAKHRLMMYHIERDWYTQLLALSEAKEEDKQAIRQKLVHQLINITPLLEKKNYFMGEDFSMVDCCLAVLLWRLPHLGITLPEAHQRILDAYGFRLFERHSFQASLTDAECDMREYDDF
jgi:RNA polymerase-associated protein